MTRRVEWWRWEFVFAVAFLEDLMKGGDLEDYLQRAVASSLRVEGGVGEPDQKTWRVRPHGYEGYVRLVLQGTSLREVG